MAKYRIGQKCKINDPELKQQPTTYNLNHGQEVVIAEIFNSPNWRLALKYQDVCYYEVLDLSGNLIKDMNSNSKPVRVPEKYLVPLTNPKQWTVEDTKDFLLDMSEQAKLQVKIKKEKTHESS